MNFGKTNIILLLAFTVSLVANWAIRPNLSKPNVEYFPNMARSVPYDAFSYNPNFVDGMTLREPVEGTIVYGRMPLHYGDRKSVV